MRKFIVEQAGSNNVLQDEEATAVSLLKEREHDYLISSTSVRPDVEGIEDYIPIGSIGFVEEHLKTYHDIPYSCPIEIPKFLRKRLYLQRDYTIKKAKDLPKEGYGFIKSAHKLKTFSYCGSLEHLSKLAEPDDWIVFSEFIDRSTIMAEFRVFVHKGEIVAVKQYDGSSMECPTVIINMIKGLMNTNFPIDTYSFDVGLIDNPRGYPAVFLIEVHLISSLGLYGFNSPSLLDMYVETYDFLKSDTHRKILNERTILW